MSTNIENRLHRIEEYLGKEPMNIYTSLEAIILNVSDVCNRTCAFCPRSHGYHVPEGHEKFMPLEVVDELSRQVNGKFKGAYSFSGFGEPLFHPQLEEILKKLNATTGRTTIVTNGYNPERIAKLEANSIDISLYSKEDDEFFSRFQREIKSPVYLKRQYKKGNTFFNNRAGNAGPVDRSVNKCCYITFMKLTIDTNGDILQCCSDWKREHVLGNIFKDNIWDVWVDGLYEERMHMLANERGKCQLCGKCNSPGDLYGVEFKEFWEKYYAEHQQRI